MTGLSEQHETFKPEADWKDVPDGAILPRGCEIRMSVGGGGVQARLRRAPWPKPVPTQRPWWQRDSVAWWLYGVLGGLAIIAFALAVGFVIEQTILSMGLR